MNTKIDQPDGLMLKHFVLSPNKNTPYGAASRAALCAYADAIEPVNYSLAADLRIWVNEIQDNLDGVSEDDKD